MSLNKATKPDDFLGFIEDFWNDQNYGSKTLKECSPEMVII